LPQALSESELPLGFEDRFVVVGVPVSPEMAPHPHTAEAFGRFLQSAFEGSRDLSLIVDVRRLSNIQNDVSDFLESLSLWIEPSRCTILGNSHQTWRGGGQSEWNVMCSKRARWSWRQINLGPFRCWSGDPTEGDGEVYDFKEVAYSLLDAHDAFDNTQDLERSVAESLSSYYRHQITQSCRRQVSQIPIEGVRTKVLEILKGRSRADRSSDALDLLDLRDDLEDAVVRGYLDAILWHCQRQSLLVEFAMQVVPGGISFVPYHASALYPVENPREDSIVVARPGILASKLNLVFSAEISEFELLINKPGVREREIQAFLESHKEFLRGLNYRDVYPQVVLERENGRKLIPDFILEPAEGEFCDLLDLKLPSVRLVAGRDRRLTLAAALHEAAAQLREYSAYFEEEKHRRWVQEQYGLKVYRPKLMVVVGRDPSHLDSEELRSGINLL
jgi:hypothetical protein